MTTYENPWLKQIERKRLITAKSVLEFKFAKSRVRQLHGPKEFPSLITDASTPLGVLYWMIRDQRVQDNWAFLYAQRLALKFQVPLYVCFCLIPCYQADTLRHFSFMLEGLMEVEQECRSLNISFHLINAADYLDQNEDPGASVRVRWSHEYTASSMSAPHLFDRAVAQAVSKLVQSLHVGCVVVDFSPLRAPSAWVEAVASSLPEHIPLCQVDAHNIVPVWCGSDKLESHARTIRPKLFNQTVKYLTEFPPLITHPFKNEGNTDHYSPIDWDAVRNGYSGDFSVEPVSWAQPGTKAAFDVLRSFINERLKGFDAQRNDPSSPALSGLSPWFHFGQIAPQRAILEVSAVQQKYGRSVDIFLEEAFNRRELAENFCFYNPLYDSITGARQWAQDTLGQHTTDTRPLSYTRDQLETSMTSDDLWNAAQRQLVHTAKMHGFLRQYWAKKILEWCAEGPQTAIDWAIYLNDRFSLDGTDPNGYVGIMWAICGIHDQGWKERAIFGKVRYMTYNGCKKWFSIPAFVTRFSE